MITIHKQGKLRGEVVLYPDGVGCCVWYPFGDDETAGVAFDFSAADIDDFIQLLQRLKEVEPDVYTEEAHDGGESK